MFIPSLVEPNIKNIVNYNLNYCHKIKNHYYNFLFNLACFIFIICIIGSILYIKYNKNKDFKQKKIDENKKRDYILYNLRKYQNIKNKPITNIPYT